jgi:hypothetical protein
MLELLTREACQEFCQREISREMGQTFERMGQLVVLFCEKKFLEGQSGLKDHRVDQMMSF